MIDYNNDDIYDEFKGSITFPSSSNEVRDIKLILFFHYGIRVKLIIILLIY